jgi:uncharacterized protein
MKNYFFFIFFGIVTLIFFMGNWYVYSRANIALQGQQGRVLFSWLFWTFASFFLIGQFLERVQPTLAGKIITNIGSVWLAVLWVSFLFVLSIDIIRLFNHFLHFIPQWVSDRYVTGPILFMGVFSVVSILVLIGFLNASFPRVNRMEVQVDKNHHSSGELNVAVVSDIHMGFIINKHHVKRLVNSLKELNPDLIIFAGDLVDHNPMPVIKDNLGKYFTRLNPPLGMVAVTGNHEYIGKPEVSINYLSKFGIRYIRDTFIELDSNVVIIGRDDRDKSRFTGKSRKSVAELMEHIDHSKTIILVDHQPVEYDEAAAQGVDLMISGHTHAGQLWPFYYLTKKVYENAKGLMIKGKTNFYVSPGYGTWGPPVRLGNRPEIALIKVKLKEE